MKPTGLLMIEHRLIMRMVSLLKQELDKASRNDTVDTDFLLNAIDFIRSYADRTHHGKEEDILFRELGKRDLSEEHARIMRELVEEHIYGRGLVAGLVQARKEYLQGTNGGKEKIVAGLQSLIEFYPKHIEKEDQHFFSPINKYFTEQELETMLEEFAEFDKKVIHEKYQALVESYEKAD